MAIHLESLKRTAYFSGCSFAELDSIKKFILEETVEKGGIFLLEGGRSDFLYFLISGVVKVYKTSADGKEQIFHIARPGDSLNDVSIFDCGPNAASMLAMTPIVLYKIRKGDLEVVMREHPQVALNGIKTLASRVRRDLLLIEDLSFTQVTARLAKVLLKLVGEATDGGPRLTQQDMAAIVGTTREVVSRSLRTMKEKGAIRLERKGVVITNKKALEGMTQASS